MGNDSGIQVLDRTASLLDALARHGQASLKVPSADTGLHSSTAFRIVASLQKPGWAAGDGAAGELGNGTSELGAATTRIDKIGRRHQPNRPVTTIRFGVVEAPVISIVNGTRTRAPGSTRMRSPGKVTRQPLGATTRSFPWSCGRPARARNPT